MTGMTCREKFLNTMEFCDGAVPPNWEFAYWHSTIERWYGEGMPRHYGNHTFENAQWVAGEACPCLDGFTEEKYYGRDVSRFFGFDERAHMVGYNALDMIPPFEEKIISETAENIRKIRSDGKRVEIRKDGGSMPHFLEYPVKDQEDFTDIKRRFNVKEQARLTENWDSLGYHARTFPLQMGGGNIAGFYSIIREMVGLEESIYLFYDHPALARDILDFFLQYYTDAYTEILAKTDVDYLLIWEDLAFKTGPLISPVLFKEFILPYYKELITMMKNRGVKHFFVDTDGNFEVLIDLFLEGGVTGFYPFESAAGMDIVAIRKRYPDLVIMGGIDKRALAMGKHEINKELEKVEQVLSTGGFIPYMDHMVPPDVGFENYRYFREHLSKLLT